MQSRVTCLKEAGISLGKTDFERYIISSLCENEILLSGTDIADIETIEQNYRDPAFLYRKGENAAEMPRGSGLKHFHGHIDGVGEIDIRVALDAGNRIDSMEASGDFFLLDDPGRHIFDCLKGVPFENMALSQAIDNTEPEKAVAGLDRAKLLHILTETQL